MARSRTLTEQLLAHAPAGAREELRGRDIEETLAAHVAAARLAWPDIAVEPTDFVAYVAERLPATGAVEALAGLRAPDMLLAWACGRGAPAALAAFEVTYLARIEGALPRVADREHFADEVKQLVREKLFVGRAGKDPKITEYQGRSDLGTWVHVVAWRVALDLLRQGEPGGTADDDVLGALPCPATDPELLTLKQRYREEFRVAIRAAAASLTARDRNLLRQHYVDKLTLDELAELYRIHRVTLARRMAAARDKLTGETRRTLLQRFGIGKKELDSIVGLFQSQFDLSMRVLLASDVKDTQS